MQREKGKRGEREVAQVFRRACPAMAADIKRGLQSRGGGAEVPDVTVPGLHVEVKLGKRPSMRAAYKQACDDKQGEVIPVAAIRDDRGQWMAVLALEDFAKLWSDSVRWWGR